MGDEFAHLLLVKVIIMRRGVGEAMQLNNCSLNALSIAMLIVLANVMSLILRVIQEGLVSII